MGSSTDPSLDPSSGLATPQGGGVQPATATSSSAATSSAVQAAPIAPRAVASSTPASGGSISPRPTPRPAAQIPATATVATATTPTVATTATNSSTPPTENSASGSLLLPITTLVISLGAIATYASLRMRAKKQNNAKNTDRCGSLKQRLDQKKMELQGIRKQISLQELIVQKLKGAISTIVDEKKTAIEERLKETAKDALLGEESMARKAVDTAEKAHDTYEDLSDKLEKAKKLYEVLMHREASLKKEVDAMSAAYMTCMSGGPDTYESDDAGGMDLPGFSLERKQSAAVLVFNGKGELLLQKRAPHDDSFPSHWDFSAGGGIDDGETAEQCAQREIKEELGIDAKVEPFSEGQYHYPAWKPGVMRDAKLFIFKAVHEGPFKPDANEVEAVRFYDPKAIGAMIDSSEKFHPEFALSWEKILARLSPTPPRSSPKIP